MATNVAICPSITGGLIGKNEKKHRLKQRFEVIRKLGQGTYGKVQLAINKETGQEVAIKTIKKSKIENEKDLIRIRREIQIMSSIQHPNIIHIFEVFENKDKIVLVMQFARGGELYEYVSERKKLADNEARRIFRQIATAIYYCHKNKVCHRDLKLENILLDDKGNAKIGDFGLSNVFDLRNTLSTFCGSALYASPEIVKGNAYFGPEVDCWSLGVLLYTLVYGAMPFDGSNYKSLVKLISEAKYFEPKQKSDASNLIRKLLCVQPNKRATIIDICTDAWVNKDCERCLLQVAEDLANLTPVKIEVLLALAPIPQSDSQTSVNSESKKSTDQEAKVTVLEPSDDQSAVKRRKSTKKSADGSKKSKDKENETSKPKSTKLKDDNNNLDAEKQKIKSSQQSKNSLNQDSDYVSEEPISLSRKSDTDKGSRSTINQSIGDLNDKQTNSQTKSDAVLVTRKPSVKGTVQKKSVSGTDDKPKSDQTTTTAATTTKKPEELVSSSSISLVRKASTKKAAAKTSPPTSISASSKEISKETTKETAKETTQKDASKDNVKESLVNKEPLAVSGSKKSLVTQQSIETEKTEDDQSTASKETTASIGPIRTQSKIGDAKRMFEKPRRQESIEREKQERIILLNKVSDVKNKFERRASVSAASTPLWKPSDRKKSIVDSNEQVSIKTPAVVTSPVPVQKPTEQHPPTPQPSKQETNLQKAASSTTNAPVTTKEETSIKPITTTSISTIKPKLVERQVSVSSSTNNPPTGNDRSNLKVRRHTVKAKTNSTAAVPTIAELKRKDLFSSIKEKPSPVAETIKETEVSSKPSTPPPVQSPVTPLSPTNKSSPYGNIIDQTQQIVPRSTPPTPSSSSQTIRSTTPTDHHQPQQIVTALQSTPAGSIEKPKLKILNPTTNTSQAPAPAPSQAKHSFNSGSVLNSNQSSSFIVQSPSIKSINSQDSLSGSTLTSTTSASKLAPIARSYKKISFTKDGATITETGRIISEETPSGTKITKKIITKKSTTPGAYDGASSSSLSRNQQSFDSETDEYNSFNDPHHHRIKSRASTLTNANSNSSNLGSNIGSSNLRKSDSTSSSGSVDIFDDIFDTWVGDNPMFNNISSKFKTLFNQPRSSLFDNGGSFGRSSKANFPSFLNRSKPSLTKSRAESCERKHNDENSMNSMSSAGPGVSSVLRRPGYSEGESDTDNEDMNGQNVGLWKFLNPNITSRFLNKHPSLMNGMDSFFGNNEDTFSNRSRERMKFDSKPPAFLSNRFKSASRDLGGDSNDGVFKTTFTIKPNGSTKIVTTTSRNNSGTNLAGGPSANNIQMFSKNNMTNSTPVNRFVERMNSEQPNNSHATFEFEPEISSDFKTTTNFPITIGRLRSQNSQINSPQIISNANIAPSFANSPSARAFNRSTSARIESIPPQPRSFMDTSNYRGLGQRVVHEIPIEQQDAASSSSQKEHYIPITRQSSVEQENNNSLLDQLRTHGYRNLVNQRNSKFGNFNLPTTNTTMLNSGGTSPAVDESAATSVQLQPNGTSIIIKTKRGKITDSLLNDDESTPPLHALANHCNDNRRMYKSLITNTQDTGNAPVECHSLTNGHSLNHLNIVDHHHLTKDHLVSDSFHSSKYPNDHHHEHNHRSNQLTPLQVSSPAQVPLMFDYKGLMNVARKNTNKLTAKYSSLSSKSLEHLNNGLTDLTPVFKHISLTNTTTKDHDRKKENKKAPNDDEIIIFGSDEDDVQLKQKLLEEKSAANGLKGKSMTKLMDKDEEDTTNMDESSTPSSTDSTNPFHQFKGEDINDLKDDYLNCSINNQVNQIQQLIQLLYAENGEENKSENSSSDQSKKKSQFKQDNYQLLRKTQSDLKELKNDLQILQLKNKLKRRLSEQKSMSTRNQRKQERESSPTNNTSNEETSAANTVTATSEEEEETDSYRKSSLKSFKSLPPLPPLLSSSSNSLKKPKKLEHKSPLFTSDRLNEHNLINQSNKRTFASNELKKTDDERCLTDNSKLLNDHHQTTTTITSLPSSHLTISQSKEHDNNRTMMSNNSTKSNAFSSRSSSALNGYPHHHHNPHQQQASLKNYNGQADTLYSNKASSNSASNSSELTRRSTIGSSSPTSKETVQERILRKSFYSRFQSPDRTGLDSGGRVRRKSTLTASDYLTDELDDYLNETNNRRLSRKSISKSISNLENRDEESDNNSSSKCLSKRSSFSRRTSHSPYRARNDDDTTDDLSDEELMKSLSSINRRNSFALGSTANRFPSLQASFERNLERNNELRSRDNSAYRNYSSSTKLLNDNISKRNSIAHIDYDSNNNLFRNGLSSLRSKLNESNGTLVNVTSKSDLNYRNELIDHPVPIARRSQLKNKSTNEDAKSSYGLSFYNNLELST